MISGGCVLLSAVVRWFQSLPAKLLSRENKPPSAPEGLRNWMEQLKIGQTLWAILEGVGDVAKFLQGGGMWIKAP